jgi:hypothetical protein
VADVVPDWVPGIGKSGRSILPGLSVAGLTGKVGLPDSVAPIAAQGDIILEIDGYEIGRARSVYQGMATRAKMDRGGR